ncbi:unnamed protein product [Phaedon cochleariae]|uniref:Uncharacterized protein n=1 Tax=Phaedon cochleariae TaxID=80249 RepID=A0A9N9SFI1_PHACE|nr:unnamed protein product [Phaedon cochleariae]
MFSSFWKLGSWGEKKVFVRGLVNTRPVRRRRKMISEAEENFKKSQGHDYFLKTINGNRIKVCRLLFINTLGLGEDSLKRWMKETDFSTGHNSSTSNSDTSSQSLSIVETKRVKSQETRRSIERKQVTETVMTWLSSIPKVPSHYCRASSNMRYVDNEFISKNNMYKIFKNWCIDEQKKAAHLKLFKTVLIAERIAIHKPRKDQCDTCVGHKCGTVSEENYIAHQQKKNPAKKYELPSNFDSIRPGKRVRDPVVVDIRQLKYLPNKEVYFTLDHSEEWTVMPRRRENQKMEIYKEQLYKTQLPISDDKYKHLQELKSVMEMDHHAFYDVLPHQQKKKK